MSGYSRTETKLTTLVIWYQNRADVHHRIHEQWQACNLLLSIICTSIVCLTSYWADIHPLYLGASVCQDGWSQQIWWVWSWAGFVHITSFNNWINELHVSCQDWYNMYWTNSWAAPTHREQISTVQCCLFCGYWCLFCFLCVLCSFLIFWSIRTRNGPITTEARGLQYVVCSGDQPYAGNGTLLWQ